MSWDDPRMIPDLYEHRPYGQMLRAGLREEIPNFRYALNAKPPIRFLIFAQGRTGSTLMTSTLNHHSEVTCHDEILGRPRVFPRRFAENASRRHGTGSFGFHVKIYQLAAWQRMRDSRKFLGQLNADGWKVIYLWRENALRHVVSNAYAEAVGAYHLWHNSKPREKIQITIEPASVIKKIEQRLWFRSAENAALANIPHLKFCYEHDLQLPEMQGRTFNHVQQYLGVKQEKIEPELHKAVDRDLPDLIKNFDEVRSALLGTRYEEFLNGI